MPQVPAVPRVGPRDAAASRLQDAVTAAFAPDGPIARALPGFEARPGQIEMAEAVSAARTVAHVRAAEHHEPARNAIRFGPLLQGVRPGFHRFAAFSLGFLSADEPVALYETGPWTRLSTSRGHVLVRRKPWTLRA